jgi:hypothetical protein
MAWSKSDYRVANENTPDFKQRTYPTVSILLDSATRQFQIDMKFFVSTFENIYFTRHWVIVTERWDQTCPEYYDYFLILSSLSAGHISVSP